MTVETPRVLVERDAHVAHVQLNRPEKRNAIDGAMFTQLRQVALDLAADRSVWAIVLSGAGHTFSSGLDTSNFARFAQGGVSGDTVTATARDLSPAGASRPQQVAWLWHEMETPVIAAIQGHAVGGGLHIALGADIRVIAPDAKVGFVEITWGLVPDLSASQSLRRLVRLDVAKRLILTGELVGGEEAVALGLATLVDPDPVARALELAHAIASRNPDATRAAKRILERSAHVTVAEGLADEVEAAASLVGTPNQIEATMARLEQRPPAFS